MLVEVAIELFTVNRKSYFFNLYTKSNRNKFFTYISNL